ncbi:DUF3298/DUF4163 domain-containing protein [Candidatus Parcubacteria bacterium]|nr:MAG: DUF3298/DUF4163 domain-containing protein [Candidatus Parcubacteria bacterium]
MNKLVVPFLVIVLVLIGAGFFMWREAEPDEADHLLEGLTVSEGEMKYHDEGQYYTIDISYPDHTSLAGSADKKARDTMETFLMGDIAAFKQNINVENISGPEKEMLDSMGRKYAYDAKYKLYEDQNGKLISYEYDIYIDTGGAHPNFFFNTFTFDTAGNEVTLADLFVKDTDYLQRISSIALAEVRTQLAERLGEDASNVIFEDGLVPREDNFIDFVIDDDALVIFIEPYQAAAYAASTFEVRIPLSRFGDMLRPEWQ